MRSETSIIRYTRLVLSVVFLVAGLTKLQNPKAFVSALADYDLSIPLFGIKLLAAVVPSFEVICGALLWLNWWPHTIRPLIAVSCGAFVVFLGQALIRGLEVECGCFGTSGWAWMNRVDIAFLRALALGSGAFALLVDAGRQPSRLGGVAVDRSKQI